MAHTHKAHFFHLIWSTKNRTKWIEREMQSRLYSYIGGIIRNYNGSLIEVGGMPDHIHLLVNLRDLDKYSLLLRDIKAHSSLWIHKHFPHLKEFQWQEGFGSYTVHHSLVENVKNYIQNQEVHHQKMTFEEEYIKFLEGQNVKYDTRFVFG